MILMPTHLEKIIFKDLKNVASVSSYLKSDRGDVWTPAASELNLERYAAKEIGDEIKPLNR